MKSAASRSSYEKSPQSELPFSVGAYEKVPPVGALIKSAASRSSFKSAASRSSYEKVPPVGALMKKCRQSELL